MSGFLPHTPAFISSVRIAASTASHARVVSRVLEGKRPQDGAAAVDGRVSGEHMGAHQKNWGSGYVTRLEKKKRKTWNVNALLQVTTTFGGRAAS